MKLYRYCLALIVASSSFMLSCGSRIADSRSSTENLDPQICMKVSEPDNILKKIRDHANAPEGSKLYLVFHGAVCPACPDLLTKIDKLDLDSELMYMNIDFTWIFVLSRHLDVRGVPTLVVFIQGVPKFAREGNASILEYLHANVKEAN